MSALKFDIIGENTMVLDVEGREAAESVFWAAAMSDDTIAMTKVDPRALRPSPTLETGKHWRKYNMETAANPMPSRVWMVDAEINRRRAA